MWFFSPTLHYQIPENQSRNSSWQLGMAELNQNLWNENRKAVQEKKKLPTLVLSPFEGHICQSLPQFPYLWKKGNNTFLPQKGLWSLID